MKAKNLILSFLLLTTLVVACGNAEVPTQTNPDITPSQTNQGITLSITNVRQSSDETVITVMVRASPAWNLDIDDMDHPIEIWLNDALLTDENGQSIALRSGTFGFGELDEATGDVEFIDELTFDASTGKTLTLQANAEILNVPVLPSFEISLADHQVNDSWTLDQDLTINGMALSPGTVTLTELTDTRIGLSFVYEKITSDGLMLSCLHFYPITQSIDNSFSDCTTTDSPTIVSKMETSLNDPTAPIAIQATGDILLTEPFIVTWRAEGE